MSSGSGKNKAEEGIQAAGQQAYTRSQATPKELAQYKSSFGTGQDLEQIYNYMLGTGEAPAGFQDSVLGKYYQTVSSDLADPYATYQSTLDQQLQLAQDAANRSAQSRGLLRSGIPIEQMGRAGVELAIKEAANRMAYRQQALSSAGELASVPISGLSSLYSQQQGYGQNALSRQSNAAYQTAQYQAYPYQAQLGSSYGSQGQLGSTIGALGGAALGGAAALALPGSQAFLIPAGASLGGSLGRSF